MNLKLSTPCRSSNGTKERKIALALSDSFLPCRAKSVLISHDLVLLVVKGFRNFSLTCAMTALSGAHLPNKSTSVQ